MFGSIYHKEALTSALLFEIILRIHQVQIKEDLILYVIHIVETRMIEAGIDGISRGKNLGGMTRLLNRLKLVPVD